MPDKKILIVEDELITVELIRDVLTKQGYNVIGNASSGQEALDLIAGSVPDLILMDIRIKGDMDGIELAGAISERHRIPIIFLTAFADGEIVDRAKRIESYAYLIKPFGELELFTNIEMALYKHQYDIKLKESEERYRTLFETMKDAVYMRTMDGFIIELNQAMIDLLGYSRDDWRTKNVQEIYSDPEVQASFHAALLQNGYVKDFEARLRRKDGGIVDTLVTASLMPVPSSTKKIVRGIIRDVTERKKAEEALRKSFNDINDLYNHAPCGYHSLDRDGLFIRMNDTELQWLGYEREDIIGKKHFSDLITRAGIDKFNAEYRRFIETGFVDNMEFELIRKDGTIIPVMLSSTAVYDQKGDYVMSRTTVFDITDRKRAEISLKESESRYHAIFEGSLNMVYLFDMKGNFIDVNEAALDFFGYNRDEILSYSFRDMVSYDDYKKGLAQTREALESGGRSRIEEFTMKTRSGDYRYIETTASPLYRDGKPYAILGVARNITERRRFVEELKIVYTENMYILNSISSLLIGVSTTDEITHWNHMAEEIFGIPASEALGKKITGYNIDWDWEEIYTGISTCITERSTIVLQDISYKDKNGNAGFLGITINPIINEANELRGFLIYGQNITERRLAEQQLLQSSKMATVGEMATGVAHELNQPLNIIKMASQFMLDGIKEKYATEEFLQERTEKIVAQVDRAAHIINHLREFGRKSDYDFAMIDPNKPIHVAFDMLREQLRLHSIDVHMDLGTGLPEIRGDLPKLEQVYINLIVNAKDAIEEMKKPPLQKEIHVTSYYKDEERMLYVEFKDNGPGIPKNIASKIFEPFFSTKEVGKGTGLGLSISYGIIKSHQGTIEAVSDGKGASFIIRFPVDSKTLD